MSKIEKQNLRNGLLFCSPILVGLTLFTLYPVISSFYYSFCNYPMLKPPTWIGFENYKTLFSDPVFYKSLWNTFYYAIIATPLGIIVAFALALLLNQKVKGMAIYRTMFFVPSIVPMVASSVLWVWLLNPQYGLINGILRSIGLPPSMVPGWMADPAWAKPALILMSTWGVGGTMLIFLAGLQDVPQDLYEAADLDGASPWQKTINITLPFMSPYIFFSLVMGFIGASQYFTQAYVMTGGTGGPVDATKFYALYLFQNAFVYWKMGYACAMAWILFIIILSFTLMLFKGSAKHVYYGGEK
ncbi:MAG: sugar ABC transporter permease [Abditibacteriota bacterium]|nr:sugar ABC transporter permease [Abditibacteriota bacterium]